MSSNNSISGSWTEQSDAANFLGVTGETSQISVQYQVGIEKSWCRYVDFLLRDVQRVWTVIFLPKLEWARSRSNLIESDLYSCLLRKLSQDILAQSQNAATQQQERTLQVLLRMGQWGEMFSTWCYPCLLQVQISLQIVSLWLWLDQSNTLVYLNYKWINSISL